MCCLRSRPALPVGIATGRRRAQPDRITVTCIISATVMPTLALVTCVGGAPEAVATMLALGSPLAFVVATLRMGRRAAPADDGGCAHPPTRPDDILPVLSSFRRE
ncbi:MAG: hypothetical protein AB2A00_43045 [Myxococcota bacterium]